MKRLRSSLAFAALIIPAFGFAQTDRPRNLTVDLAAGAVAQVRAKYFAMDYIGAAVDAEQLLKRFPHSRELAAWRVANFARISKPREAKAAADALLKSDSTDPWGWFAQTAVLVYASEGLTPPVALKTSLEAYKRAPNNPDIQWLRAVTLSGNGEAAQATALIDSIGARGPLPQQLRTLQATVKYSTAQNGMKTDKAKADSALALYAKVRESDPTDVTARVFAASRLAGSGKFTESYDLAKEGVRLSPLALGAHQTYWQTIDGLKDRPQASRDSEIFADVERLLAARGNEPTVLGAAADQYESHRQPERARAAQDRVLAVAPNSLQAEWVLVNRYRAVQKQLRDSVSRDTTGYVRTLWAFVDRSTHQSDRLIGDAYRELYRLSDSTTNADTLLRIVRGMVKYEGINPHIVYAGGAIRLAERGRDFKIAEQLTRDGLKEGKAKIDEQRSFYETAGDYAKAVDWMSAFMHDALGVVYLHEGRLDDARHELLHARELDPKSVSVLAHLGQLSERRAQLDSAEQYYVKGALLSALGSNPNRAALQRVYAVRHGSSDGYDAYMANLAESDRANRRAEIAKSRIASPAALSPFSLRTLDGALVSSDSLRGRAAVINNWGMWCGPCVAELPEFQTLTTNYAGDTTVRILTIDNDPNTDSLRLWMGKRKYTFTTLIDDGFLARQDLHVYPTTWFLDANGRIVFEKRGWSEKLVEEFGWRIEMLRKP